ncbi:MAG TPA: HAD family hydrolase [Candidatus Saccharibacteria bacterium]|nr:HAD family hydrolase [Candidatus Saccharibacteria bacterium]
MSMKPTVIFDFDGTLANTLELVANIYNEHAAQFGARQIDMNEFDEYRKLGYKKATKKAGIRWTVLPRMVLFISKEMKAHMGSVKPYDGIVQVLKDIQQAGMTIGVLTSNDAQLVRDFFDAHGFPHFDFIVSEKTLFGKDKALKRIMKRHGLAREQVLYVGDEPRDIAASHKAGIRVVGVTWGVGGRVGLEPTKADAQVDTPRELKEALFKMNGLPH